MRTAVAALGLVLATGLAACTSEGDEEPASGQAPQPAGRAASPADFVDAECPADVASVVVGEVTCGFLTVPEDRAAPERDVRLFVARIQPPEVLHEDPMFVAGTDLANLPNYGGVAPLAQRVGREVILMDTRGVGHSEPSLSCPEVDEIQATVVSTATDDAETHQDFLDAVAACHERISATGVDPGAYHLSEMAADAEALRNALQIDQWNVVTYGTASRIALEMVRQSPEGLRSVLLDSPEVPGIDPRAMAVDGTRAALSAVLQDCDSDRRCRQAFRDVDTLLDRALLQYADAPVTLTLSTAGGKPAEVLVDDALLLRLLRGMLSDGGSSGSFMRPASVPAFLEGAVAGRLDELAASLATNLAASPPYCLGYLPKCLPQHRASVGTAYSVLCRDIDPVHDGAAARSAVDASEAGFSSAYGASPYLDVCGAWPVTGSDDAVRAEDVDARVASEVPVLTLVGAFSPYSTEGTVRESLADMPRATLVVDPAGGHNVMSSDCLVSIRGAWLDDLDLTARDQDCLELRETDWVTDLAGLGAQPVGDPPESPGVTPTDPPTNPPTGSSTVSLEGVWDASLTRDEIRSALAEGDFPGLATRFFDSEGITPDGLRTRTTFEDGRFSQAYQGSDGAWQVGWETAMTITGDRVELTDDTTGGTDTLRWRITDGRVHFTPVSPSSPLYNGIPQMAYLWAYFAADTHRRAG